MYKLVCFHKSGRDANVMIFHHDNATLFNNLKKVYNYKKRNLTPLPGTLSTN